jgi:O-antigen ligase
VLRLFCCSGAAGNPARGPPVNNDTSFGQRRTSVWGVVVAVWLSLIFFLGGRAIPQQFLMAALACCATLLILAASWRLRFGFPTRLSFFVFLLGLLAFALACAQLIPLPAHVFSALPGRETLSSLLIDVGVAEVPRPMSLSPHGTADAILGSLPAFACFMCAVSLQRSDFPAVGLSISLTAIVCAFLALLQRSAPADSWLHFFGYENQKVVAGTFENRNFLATQMVVAIPFLAAFAMSLRSMFDVRDWLVVVFAIVYGVVVLAGLAVSGSRAGIVLAMASVALTVILVFRHSQSQRGTRVGFAGLPLIIVGSFFILAQASMVGILRLSNQDALGDYRNVIYQITTSAIRTYFPLGSGFGSFVPVYKIHETADALRPSFVNAAHNDWLQVALEGGLPAILIIAAIMVASLFALFRIVTLPSNVATNGYFRASAVAVFLLAAHGLVDYPMRMVSLFAFLAFCLGLMTTSGAVSTWSGSQRETRHRRPAQGVDHSENGSTRQNSGPIERPRPSFSKRTSSSAKVEGDEGGPTT